MAMLSAANVPRCASGGCASTTQPTRQASSLLGHGAGLAGRPHRQQQQQQQRGALQVVAADGRNLEQNLLGNDFGARDAFPAELESNFSDKVLGNYDTEHIIKPPDKIKEFIGLHSKRCVPCEGEGAEAMRLGELDVERLRNQVPGWRVAKDRTGAPCIRQEWKVKGADEAQQLFALIGGVAEDQGHHPDLHMEGGGTTVLADLTTHAAGGLTENDFIVAAKINELDVKALLQPKKVRYWA